MGYDCEWLGYTRLYMTNLVLVVFAGSVSAFVQTRMEFT